MTLWRRWWERLSTGWSMRDVDPTRTAIFAPGMTLSGRPVTVETALRVSTTLACARVIADGIAQVPLKLFQLSPDGRTRTPAVTHPAYRVLHRRPNPWQTSFEFRQTLGFHLALMGRGYCLKIRARGHLAELLLLEPHRMRTSLDSDGVTIRYRYTPPSGSTTDLPPEAVWHVKGPSWSGWEGMNATHLAAEAIGLALATEEHHATMHAKGARPSGLYSVEGTLSSEQYRQLREWFAREYEGVENAHRTMILDRAAKWFAISPSGVDSQHLETRRYQVEEICRFFRVMPIMVGYSDKATTYASAEQMFLAHVVHTMSPWWECLEQSIDVNLLTPADERDGIYAKFVEEGLLRGAAKDTAEVLDRYVNGGLMTPNEGRAKLDLNPMPGEENDRLRVPANIVGRAPASPEPASSGAA